MRSRKWDHMRSIQVAKRYMNRVHRNNPRAISSFSNSLLGKLEKGLRQLQERYYENSTGYLYIGTELDKVIEEMLERTMFEGDKQDE